MLENVYDARLKSIWEANSFPNNEHLAYSHNTLYEQNLFPLILSLNFVSVVCFQGHQLPMIFTKLMSGR